MLTKANHYKAPEEEHVVTSGNPDPENELSMSEAPSFIDEMKAMPDNKQKGLDLEFKDNFSFGKYLEMHWRVEYLEA